MSGLLMLPPGESVDVAIRFEPPYASQEGTQSGAGTCRSRKSLTGQRSSVPGGGALPSARGQAQAAACLPEALTRAQYAGALRVTFSTGQQQVSGSWKGSRSQAGITISACRPTHACVHAVHAKHAIILRLHQSHEPHSFVHSFDMFHLLRTGLWCVQVLPLQATVEQPELLVSSAKVPLDFGAVHPAAPRTLELVITNPTGAQAAWQASIQPLAPPAAAEAAQQLGRPVQQAAASAFTVLPQQGVLAGRGLGMPKQTGLQVVFAPFCSGAFAAALRLGVHGGREVSAVLMGQGVHAEGAELRAAYDL